MPWTGKPSPTQWRSGALPVVRTFLAVSFIPEIWGLRGPSAIPSGPHVERIHHHIGMVGVGHLHHQRVGAGAQAVRPEDGHLVALHRVALAQHDLAHLDAVDGYVGGAAGAALLAA